MSGWDELTPEERAQCKPITRVRHGLPPVPEGPRSPSEKKRKRKRPPSSGCTTCGNALAHAAWCKEANDDD